MSKSCIMVLKQFQDEANTVKDPQAFVDALPFFYKEFVRQVLHKLMGTECIEELPALMLRFQPLVHPRPDNRPDNRGTDKR